MRTLDYRLITFLFLIWNALLTAFLIWVILFFRKLSKKVGKGNLIKVLDKVLGLQEKAGKDIKGLEKEIEKIWKESEDCVQKKALVRFNPFNEVGGDQSFSLVMLDKKDDGFVLTGLHSRERTRIYVKNIKEGKSKIDLSKEEKKALKLAIEKK